MINVNLIGRLGLDAEVREGKNGGKYVSLRIATDEFRNGKNETVWLNVYDYSERGLKMSQYWKKGTMLQVFGSETVGIYQNKNGEWVASRDIRAYNIDFVNGGSSTSGTTTSTTVETKAVSQPSPSTASCGTFQPTQTVTTHSFTQVDTNDEDNLPF